MEFIREALLRNGVLIYNDLGEDLTIENGFGSYLLVRNRSGMARYRIRSAELSNKLVVEDYYSGSIVKYIDIF